MKFIEIKKQLKKHIDLSPSNRGFDIDFSNPTVFKVVWGELGNGVLHECLKMK